MKKSMSKAGVMVGGLVLVLCGTAVAQYPYPYQYGTRGHNGSVGVKLIGFFPNQDSDGLKDFSTGIGIGVDSRFNFGDYFALGVELDYTGVSSWSGTNYDTQTATYYSYTMDFSNVALKLDALGRFPLNNIIPFLGVGLVYNSSAFDTSTGQGYYGYGSVTAYGLGLEAVVGSDFVVGGNGAVTAELSVPIDQYSVFPGSTVNVGGYEVMAGYRFLF